jgi:GTPase
MTHTIAIVGRPNVGKSTLFNRLAGRRLALVDPTPGLTRDRKETETTIFDEPVILIDTAGLEEADAGSITSRMRDQTLKGVADADLVLFLVDARAGVTPLDRSFAELVRDKGRPVLPVANKCEGKSGESGYYETFSLGLGEPVAISAEHGEGISDLQMEILARLKADGGEMLPEYDPDAEEDDVRKITPGKIKPVRIAVVGRPNAGKSTLVNAMIGEERLITGPEPGTTRDSIAVDLKHKGVQLKLFDTAGLRKRAKITETVEKLAVGDTLNAVRFAEVVILLVDAEHPFEAQDLQIGELAVNEGRALVIGVNKWDLVEDRQKRLREIREIAERAFADAKGIGIIPVSAKSGQGMDKLLDGALAVYETWNRRLPTAGLNRWLAEALEKHSPPAVSGKRIKMRYMTQANARPPTFIAFCSRPEALPKSYVRYLVNALRDSFDLQATPIRFQLRKGDNPYEKKGKRR